MNPKNIEIAVKVISLAGRALVLDRVVIKCSLIKLVSIL